MLECGSNCHKVIHAHVRNTWYTRIFVYKKPVYKKLETGAP